MIDHEITPAHLRCQIGACVSVYTLTDGQLLIIGKKPSSKLSDEIAHKVAADEDVIVIDPAYFSALQNSTA